MPEVETRPELDFLSELYFEDAPSSPLLAEYPSSNSDETIFQNKTRFVIHDPFPPPPKELLTILGPHHLMCGWGNRLPVTSQIEPPLALLEHWSRMLGDSAIPQWKPFDRHTRYVTLFPHESISREQQLVDPSVNYELHSKEVIEKIECPQADILRDVEFPCIVKLSHGYAGLGNYLLKEHRDEKLMLKELEQHWPDADLVINSVIEHIEGDFGVQFYLQKNGGIIWLGFTQQQFDGNKRWCGGTFSGQLQDKWYGQFCRMIQPVAKYLHARGYYGVVGIDILTTTTGEQYLVDVNPRLTGISPFLMASRIWWRDEGLAEGIYQASVRFSGSYQQLIESAEEVDSARVMVVSAFEDSSQNDVVTICHLSVTSDSQQHNQRVLDKLLR